jgi:phosphatidate cytidylyltransferase
MLLQRILTAIVAAALILLVLFAFPAAAAKAVIAAIILAAAWEWAKFLSLAGAPARLTYVAAIGLLLAVVTWLTPTPGAASVILKIGLAWWLAALIWVFFYPTPITRLVGWICGALVLVPAYIALVSLYSLRPSVLLFALIIIWAADIGAYFAGKSFGRIKLAPHISPGKTWEGVIGGLVAVVLVLVAVRLYWIDIDVAIIIPFCLAVATLSVVGDLTVSMFKRSAGLKDSGRVFPGHGGVLDRIDSVTAAAPLFALGIGWVGLA